MICYFYRYAHELETGRLLVEVGQAANYHGLNVGRTTSSSSSSDANKDESNVDTVELLQLRLSRLQRTIGNILDSLYIIDS